MKHSILIAAPILVFAASIPVTQAIATPPPAQILKTLQNNARRAYIVHSVAYPNTARVPSATYHFGLNVKDSALSQLLVNLPENLVSMQNVEVTDQVGRKIATTVSRDGQKVTIAFAQPVVPDTTLEVNFNGVKTFGTNKQYLLEVFGVNAGSNSAIPFGLAQIQTYGR